MDGGHIQVLEVLVAATFMIGAVLFVQTLVQPSDEGAWSEEAVRQRAEDLLSVLAYQDPPGNASASRLAHEVARAYQGDPVLETHVNRYFPHEDWSLVLRTEEGGTAHVARDGAPTGDVVTATRPFVPGWSHGWGQPRMAAYGGEHPMQVVAHPVHNSRADALDGEAIKATVVVDDDGEEKRYHVYEAAALDPGASGPASILGQEGTGQDVLGFDFQFFRDECKEPQDDGIALEDTDNRICTLEFAIDLPDSRKLSAGASLQLDIPHNWTYRKWGDSSGSWEVISPPPGTEGPTTLHAEVRDGETVTDGDVFAVELNGSISGETPFSRFEARLGDGSLSRAEVVVPHPDVEAKAPRAVYTSAPYPALAGGTQKWGIAFSNGLPEATVTEVRLESVHGTPLFEDAAVVQPLSRSGCPLDGDDDCARLRVSDDGTRIVWTGEETVLQGETRDLVLDVTAAEAETAVSPLDERTHPTVRFENGYEHDLTRQVGAPGLYSGRVPPASEDVLGGTAADGYPHDVPLLEDQAVHEATLVHHPVGELWRVESEIDYVVEETAGTGELVLDTQGAVAASRADVAPKRTSPGSLVWAGVNASSLLSQASLEDADDATLETRLYAPPSLGETPVQRVRTNLSGDGVGSAVNDALARDVTGDGDADAVLAGDDDRVHAYAVDEATLEHEPLWSADVGAAARTLAAGAGGDGLPRVYAGDADGEVAALDGAGGVTWTHDVDDAPVRSLRPADADGDGATDVLWVLSGPDAPEQVASGAGGGTTWTRIDVRYAGGDGVPVTGAAGSPGGAPSGASAARLGDALVVGVAHPEAGDRGTWINATGTDGTLLWSRQLPPRYEAVSDLTVLDADGDGRLEVAAALPAGGFGTGTVAVLDGDPKDGGSLVAEVEVEEPRLLEPVGDVTGAGGDDLAVATGADSVGVLSLDGPEGPWAWRRQVLADPEADLLGTAPDPEPVCRDGSGSVWERAPACVLTVVEGAVPEADWMAEGPDAPDPVALPVHSGAAPPRPVSLNLVEAPTAAVDDTPRLALTYASSLPGSDPAAGAVALLDPAQGSTEGSAQVPPDAGAPLAADAPSPGAVASAPWVAAGTDRGHLVLAGSDGIAVRHSQATEDASRFLLPIRVGEGALYGSYLVDHEVSWTPADGGPSQATHLVTRFAVEPAHDPGREGFVYDATLNLATPHGD